MKQVIARKLITQEALHSHVLLWCIYVLHSKQTSSHISHAMAVHSFLLPIHAYNLTDDVATAHNHVFNAWATDFCADESWKGEINT
jgi:hypothetical protein